MFAPRLRLRHAAKRLTTHGWPVTPGAPLRGRRFDCGRGDCPTRSCHPALASWQQATCHDPRAVAARWRAVPYSVLLPTGFAFDVIEVPAPLGALVLARRRDRAGRPDRAVVGPVAATPTGRWMFLVRPGEPLLPALARRLDLVRHARGSWVPAPPTRLREGPVRWVVSPAEVRWRLPDSHAVQQRLAAPDPTASAGRMIVWTPVLR